MHPLIDSLITAIDYPGTWFFSRIFQNPKLLILRLPPYLLEKILNLLPLPSQACLILTCHKLYHTYKLIIQDHRLQFPQLLANHNPTISLDQANMPHNIFLYQFQDKEWAFYKACFKFYPRTQIEKNNICYLQAGIINLYSYISLTHQDKRYLVRIWLSRISNTDP